MSPRRSRAGTTCFVPPYTLPHIVSCRCRPTPFHRSTPLEHDTRLTVSVLPHLSTSPQTRPFLFFCSLASSTIFRKTLNSRGVQVACAPHCAGNFTGKRCALTSTFNIDRLNSKLPLFTQSPQLKRRKMIPRRSRSTLIRWLLPQIPPPPPLCHLFICYRLGVRQWTKWEGDERVHSDDPPVGIHPLTSSAHALPQDAARTRHDVAAPPPPLCAYATHSPLLDRPGAGDTT